MIHYRVFGMLNENLFFYHCKADDIKKAVGKFLLAFIEPGSEFLTNCKELFEQSIMTDDREIFAFDSEDLKFICTENTAFLPDEPVAEDLIKYTFLNLPPHMHNSFSVLDVEWVICQRDEFMETHAYSKYENDPKKYFCLEEAVEFIYQNSLWEQKEFTSQEIEFILRSAYIYELATPDHSDEIRNFEAIDITSICEN